MSATINFSCVQIHVKIKTISELYKVTVTNKLKYNACISRRL